LMLMYVDYILSEAGHSPLGYSCYCQNLCGLFLILLKVKCIRRTPQTLIFLKLHVTLSIARLSRYILNSLTHTQLFYFNGGCLVRLPVSFPHHCCFCHCKIKHVSVTLSAQSSQGKIDHECQL